MKRPRFGRVPDTVGADPRLSATDVRVYWVLARSAITSGAVVQLGMRKIAEIACCSVTQVVASMRSLADCAHIRVDKTASGKRAQYMLTSPVFRPPRRPEVVEETLFEGAGLKLSRKARGRMGVVSAPKAAAG